MPRKENVHKGIATGCNRRFDPQPIRQSADQTRKFRLDTAALSLSVRAASVVSLAVALTSISIGASIIHHLGFAVATGAIVYLSRAVLGEELRLRLCRSWAHMLVVQ